MAGYKPNYLDREYLVSGVWKCEKSPTGAHHWYGKDNTELFTCIWCGEEKELPITYQLNKRR